MSPVDAAHDYARRGWGVVPLFGYNADTGQCRCPRGRFCPEKNRGKHPVFNEWQKKPLRSGADVQAWYDDHAEANVGILTGVESGIFVFDVDGAAGVRSVTEFTGEHGALPHTRIVRTGSGGLHYFFKHPTHFVVRGSTSWLAPGIDIRGYGGQVVAPPSRSGRGPYEVIADHPVAEPPSWLADLLREHSRNFDAGHTAEVKSAERVDVEFLPPRLRDLASTLVGEDEGRHKHFHALVAACFENGYSQGQAVTIAAPWCAAVDKFVGRVEAEVARSWGKLEAEAKKANDWMPGIAGPGSVAPPATTRPDPAPTDGATALQPVTQPDPAADPAAHDEIQPAAELAPTWHPVDLDPILDGTYEPERPALYPRTDGICLLYPGRVHSFHGESESGKSLVVQAESARLIRDGQDVLYIDFESDAGAVVGRMVDLGCASDEIRSHFTYLRPDNDPRKFPHEREEYAALLRNSYALAVVDGMTDALGVFGAGTTDNDEIAAFMRSFPRLVARRTGAAVVVIDHVTKDADSRGRFALGGQAKMNALDGSAFVVEIVEPLGRGMKGSVTLRVAKDRPGGVRPHSGAFRKGDRTQEAARVIVDSRSGTIEVAVEPPHVRVDNDGETRKTWRPTILMERVSDLLERAVGKISSKDIEDGVGGNRDNVRQAVALLVAEGFIEVEIGPRNARLHNLAKPYAADLDPLSDTYSSWLDEATKSPSQTTTSPTSPDLAPTSPKSGTATSPSPSPPPTGMGEVSGGLKTTTSPTTSPKSGKPYDELNCNGCGELKPAAMIESLKGFCMQCHMERK